MSGHARVGTRTFGAHAMPIIERLTDAGIKTWLSRTSALDRYLRRGTDEAAAIFMDVEGTLVDIARAVDHVEYPGIAGLDAAVSDGNGETAYIRCLEQPPSRADERIEAFALRYDPDRDRYVDPADTYRCLRRRIAAVQPSDAADPELIMDAALLSGRYHFDIDGVEELHINLECRDLAATEQRIFMELLLSGDAPERGLRILRTSGFIERYWPLLSPMDSTDHAKEFHPEGNVWAHTLETFGYRKSPDLIVGLALLLHDCGKPYAEAEGEHRFKKHADIGADYARRFLLERGFDPDTVSEVAWLIRHHMIPGALEALPRYRTRDIMRSERFPRLLEVYRCDLCSTFRGPENYYRACRVYRSFLKHDSNPFRDELGRKLLQRFVD